MHFPILSLIALVTTVTAVAHTGPEKLSINPLEPRTNAKRFAVGLPPLPPNPRRRSPFRGMLFLSARVLSGLSSAPITLGSKIDTARRTTVSPVPPVTVKCNLFLTLRSAGVSSTAYLSTSLSEFGSYTGLQSSQDGALQVSFSYWPDDPSSLSLLDMRVDNPPNPAYPYFGASVRQDNRDMGTSIISYGTISGTGQTDRGAPAAVVGTTTDLGIIAASESAIWKYDPSSGKITPQWINSDGSMPDVYLIYISETQFILTGNQAIIYGQYRSAKSVEMVCVPPTTA